MFKKLKIAIVSALLLGTASAALAQSVPHHSASHYTCQTDEGQGRTAPCDGGDAS
jgi:hypothetical protein